MRRLCYAFVALLALLAASPDAPTIVVFPFQAPASVNKDAAGTLLTMMSDALAQDGTLRVLPAEPNVERAGYLASARKAGAQFYVTGYLTPLGNGASIIEQVVSTQSGIVVYSNSGQISTLADVRAQGDIIRRALLASIAHGVAVYQPPAESTPSPRASQSSEANVGGLFRHRRAATPSPSPSPSATP